jgi:hypothetical protein
MNVENSVCLEADKRVFTLGRNSRICGSSFCCASLRKVAYHLAPEVASLGRRRLLCANES